MEWAWKPMAAVMNENKTDLIYWVPPLYASNILNSFTNTDASSSNSSPLSSLCSSPSLSRARSLNRRASYADGTPMGSRKKRLSKRRENLTQRHSIEEVGEDREFESDTGAADPVIPHLNSALHNPNSTGRNGHHKDGKHAGTMKKDLVVEFEAEEIDLVQIIPNHSDIDDEIEQHNREQLKMKEKKDNKGKRKSVPAILKILEKVSNLHHEKNKFRNLSRRNAKIERTVSSGSQKIKRPSLKVYQNNPKCGSGRRATAPAISTQALETEAKEARMVITGKAASGPRLSIKRASRQSSVRSRSASITTTGLKVSQVTEAELRSAHLEMMIKILATLYEEKISRQDTEIKTLRDKYKTQDKIVKQIVHSMLEVKTEVKSLREYLIKHEEIFLHHRTQQLMAQQSIPEEIEDDDDLETEEVEPHLADPNTEVNDDSPNLPEDESSDTCIKEDPENYEIDDPISDEPLTVFDSTSPKVCPKIIVPNHLELNGQLFLAEDINIARNFILNVDECQVLDPPDEFQSQELEERFAVNYTHRPVARSPDVHMRPFPMLKPYKDHLEAQDSNEFNLHYHKIDSHPPEGIDEHFLATQYVCDYHPREELRMKQLRDKIYYEETLSNIEEDDRCSVISRQRSDDSTNI